MSLTNAESELLAQRDSLNDSELMLLDAAINHLERQAKWLMVPLAGDDRAARLEAALIRLIIDSRE